MHLPSILSASKAGHNWFFCLEVGRYQYVTGVQVSYGEPFFDALSLETAAHFLANN